MCFKEKKSNAALQDIKQNNPGNRIEDAFLWKLACVTEFKKKMKKGHSDFLSLNYETNSRDINSKL